MRPHPWVISHEQRPFFVLILISRRLWGNPNHLKAVATALRAKHPEDSLYILVAKRNTGNFTYDGIELGGERVCQEIEEEVEKLAAAGQTIKRFSVVGYSLGGLVGRYAVGLLENKGFFKNIKPVVRPCKIFIFSC